MKFAAFIFSLILFGIFTTGCDKENTPVFPLAQVTSRSHTVNDLNEIRIADPFQVYVQFAQTGPDLRIEANENLHEYIEVRQTGGALAISLKDEARHIEGTPVLKVFLTAKALRSIQAQGAAKVYLQSPWQTDQAEVVLTGASHLEGTVMTTAKLTAELTGASTIDIAGNTQQFDVEATGASYMTGYNFECDQLFADLTGACGMTLTVNDNMRVTATGASTVRYRGEGEILYQELSGGSEIIKE